MGKSSSSTPRVATEVGPWAQIPVWVLEHDLSAAELKVYIALRSFSHARLGSGDDQGVFPHVDTIAKRANIHVRTAEKAIARLRERGLISSQRRYNDRGWIRGCDYLLADLPVPPLPKGEAVHDDQSGTEAAGPNRPNGRGVPGETAGEVTGQTTGAVTDQGELTTEAFASQDSTSSGGTSRGGTPASLARPKSKRKKPKPKIVRGQHLVGLSRPALTKKLVTVWTAVVLDSGGEPPLADTGGWGPDGLPLSRGEHPVGHQIKEQLVLVPDHCLEDAEWLDGVLDNIRAHAVQWAQDHPQQQAAA